MGRLVDYSRVVHRAAQAKHRFLPSGQRKLAVEMELQVDKARKATMQILKGRQHGSGGRQPAAWLVSNFVSDRCKLKMHHGKNGGKEQIKQLEGDFRIRLEHVLGENGVVTFLADYKKSTGEDLL